MQSCAAQLHQQQASALLDLLSKGELHSHSSILDTGLQLPAGQQHLNILVW